MENSENIQDQSADVNQLDQSAELNQPETKKAKKKKVLTCTTVQKIAFNNEEVVFENDDVKVTLNIKNPELQNHFQKGKSYNNLL